MNMKYKCETLTSFSIALFIVGGFLPYEVHAEETIEYVAEHLLEVPMDARALAFPKIPSNESETEARIQVGYGHFNAGKLSNSTPMLGAQYFYPFNEDWGLLGGAFYDGYQFSGKKGKAVGGVLVVNAPNVPPKFDVDITNIDGSGRYTGASLAVTYTPGETWRWQLGYARSVLHINKFKINFNTTSLNNNFSGSFDYANRYDVNTLFLAIEMAPRGLLSNFTYSPHLIAVMNGPRAGFQGRFTGPDFDYSGNTNTNGKGTHIPDSYLGVGVNIEHKPSGFRVDLGATIYTYAFEPYGHKGISTQLFVTMSFPIF